MPWAWSWSAAITSPAASGWLRRNAVNRSLACSSTVASHSPSRLSAVRSRWDARARSSGSSNAAACASPSGAIHSMNPLIRGKYTGRTTRPSPSASA
jgi:hypothetical protein